MKFLSCLLVTLSLGIGMVSADMNGYLKRTGAKYLEDKAKEANVISLKSGMLVEILESATDENAKSPKISDQCDVTYVGTLKDGTKFDGGRTSFAPNQVIKGWTEALQMMAEGDKWRIHIPYNLAYGERGSPPKIPPYSTLVFELQIHTVKAAGKSLAEARKLFEESVKPAEEL